MLEILFFHFFVPAGFSVGNKKSKSHLILEIVDQVCFGIFDSCYVKSRLSDGDPVHPRLQTRVPPARLAQPS